MDKNLIKQMQRGEFYPHPVTDSIQLIQTHISYIFLAGEYAYKVKKSVSFNFLDFSTLAKRHYFIQEELRLNQPVAPDIYLEVLKIVKVGDKYQFAESGEAVEYALKMRQFSQANLLSNLYKAGKLTEAHLQQLAEVVADFHSASSTNDYMLSFGDLATIRASIDNNYEQTYKYVGTIVSKQKYEEIKAFTAHFFRDKPEIFPKRQKQEKIKECHGDLHLQNICIYQGKIQLFDRIEFNESFRYVDVMYDLAFVVMDLEAKRRQDLANVFLNRYLEITGDWEGLEVLPLYLCRQAYVRAKVHSLVLDDSEISPQAKTEAKNTAAMYYDLAWQYSQTKTGKIMLMCGLSGSGKTTVARQKAKEIQAIHIRSDAVRKHLGDISLDARGDKSLYTAEMTEKTYQHLLDLGINLALLGYTVILDATYEKRIQRQKAIARATSRDLPLKILYCTAPLEILRQRIQNRRGDISDANLEVLEKQVNKAEAFTEDELPYVTTINTDH